jgi:hypothetical protein
MVIPKTQESANDVDIPGARTNSGISALGVANGSEYVSSLEERQEIPAEVQAERDLQAALDKQLEEAKENLDKLRKLRKDQEVPASSDNE